ncbi:MAG: hypothetical protein Q7T71_14135 [Herbiconiux sp.]|nr:hypothetical protein [Herbiconiux sp.]
MTHEDTHEHTHDADEQDAPQSEGQVSEVSGMDPAEATTPIQPDQATAGYQESESGSPDEGPAGPNANPNAGTSKT